MKNLFQMMSTPKKDNLWEGIQGYQDGGLLNMMPSPNEEDIINVNYFGQPQKELEGLATEAFGRERNPLAQMLMRSESAAQAGDERRVAEAVQRSKDYNEQLLNQEIADIYSRGERRDARTEKFDKLKSGFSDFLSGLKGDKPTQAEMNLEDMASEAFSPDSALSTENWATPVSPKISNNLLAATAPTPEESEPNLGTKLLESGLKTGAGLTKAGLGAGAAGIGALGAGLGYGIKGTGALLGALAGIPGDIAKAYQSYGEGERYPALAQLASASQGNLMPSIYSSLYRQDGGIIPYAVGGQVQQDPNKTLSLSTTNPYVPPTPYDITLPSTGGGDEGGGSGIPPVNPPSPPNPPNPPNPPGGNEPPNIGAGDEGMGGGDYWATPTGDPNVSYGYSSDNYGSGQLGTTGQYMGDYGGYASMFGGDTGAAASLSQAEANLGIQLTDEQRKLYGEYDPRIEEMGINIGGRRGLLGLTRERQSQLGGAGFAGMGAGAYGEAREDLLRDMDLQKRSKRAGYQKDIASQVAEDIRAGVNIEERQDIGDIDVDNVYGDWDVPPLEDPSWNPPTGAGSGTQYNFNGVNYVFDPPHWVTEDQYESDIDDYYGGDDF